MRLLRQEINEDNREYYINDVNAPLVKLIQWYAMRFPKPVREGEGKIVSPVSLRLLEIQETYLGFEGNARLRKLGEAIFRVIIAKCEHSPNYRYRFLWFFEMVAGMKPRPLNHPEDEWNEPKPYGGK